MFVLLRKRRLIPAAFFCGFLLLPLLLWAGLSIYPVQTFGVENGEARVVIIDPGHGGRMAVPLRMTVRRKVGSIWRCLCAWREFSDF